MWALERRWGLGKLARCSGAAILIQRRPAELPEAVPPWRKPRAAVSAALLIYGAVFGSWVPRLPAFKEGMRLSDGQIGEALLVFSVGAVAGAILARLALPRGARRWVRLVTVALCAALVASGLAAGFPSLVAGLLCLGLSGGFLDVLENSMAASVESAAGRPLINGFHGFWSLGAILGSVTAALAAHAGVRPLPQFAATAAVLALGSLALLGGLPDTTATPGSSLERPRALVRGVAVSGLAALAFLAIMVESGGGNWSGLYLREYAHADPGLAAGGFGGFATAMTLARFGADRLTARFGQVAVARLGSLLAAAGFALAIAVPSTTGATAGFALVGGGVAVLVPLAFSAGANLAGAGTALSLVAAAGFAGSLVGPPLIGIAADRIGLRTALALPLVAALTAALLAAVVRQPATRNP